RGSPGKGTKQSPDIAILSGVARFSLAATPYRPPLPLDKRTLELIQDRLEQIAQHGPAAGLHEHFRRHARGELQPGQPPALLFRQHDADGEIGRAALLVL